MNLYTSCCPKAFVTVRLPVLSFVAGGLGISARQTEILLDALHDGNDVEDAIRAAEIDPTAVGDGLLVQLARVIGTALGRVVPKK